MYSDHSRECRDHTRQDTVTLIPGAIVKEGDGRTFRLGTILGVGTFAKVFRAVDVQTGMMCAIKFERPEFRGTDFSKNELQALGQIESPFVLKPLSELFVETPEGRSHGIVMEYVEGNTLYAELTIPDSSLSKRLDPSLAAEYAAEIALALRAMDQQGLVHRDLKPSNILLQTMTDGSKMVRVADFGVAEEDDDRGQIVPQDPDAQWKQGFDVPPQKGTLRGTPSVIAPEGFLGVPVTSKSDIYALGVILYEMLSGYVPVNRPFEYQKGVPIRIPDFVSRGVYEIPLALEQLVFQMLAYEPDDRPNAMEVYERIKGWAASEAPQLMKKMPFDYDFEKDIAYSEALIQKAA